MKLCQLVAVFLCLSATASGVVITLGPSSQAVTFTGMGPNASGAGTSRLSWGTCVFDGTNTTCTVSGPYTGLGSGGTYSFVLVYPGNGPSPLSAVASPPGSDLVYFNLTAGTFSSFITPNGGSPINFYDFTFSVFFSPSTDSCTGVSTCSVGAVGASAGSTITGPVNGAYDLTPVINPAGVVTATDFGGFGNIAPATFIEIYGLNLSTTLFLDWSSAFVNGQAPQSLGGTTATVGGIPAYVELTSPHQVNVLVPSTVATGRQSVVITTAGGASVAFTVNVNPISPGMLAPPVFKFAAGQYAFAVFPDNRTFVLPPGVAPANIPTSRAKPGDVIIMYGLGFGPVSPALPAGTLVQTTNSLPGFSAAFGGVAAQVQFAGLVQGFTGLYQFNVVVPNIPANDATSFTFSVGGTAGLQTLLLPIGN